jgi:DNA-binding CsgD family transcriptional regulator
VGFDVGILELIGAVYDAALDVELWPCALEQFVRTFGSTSAHLSQDNLTSTAGKLVSYGFDPSFSALYAQYYAARNVLWKSIVRRSLAGVLTDRLVMAREELERSEFYNEFLQPQGGEEMLCFVEAPHRGVCTSLVLMREQRRGIWGARDMKALATVTPHFNRALGINRQLGDLRMIGDVADEALYRLDCGVVLVDSGASVLFANRVAERLFHDGLRLERTRLAAQRPGDTAALRRAIDDTAQSNVGRTVVIEREERAPLIIVAAPMAAHRAPTPGVILFVRDMEAPATSSLSSFASHFGLTTAEASAAAELAKADGVNAAAARLGVSRATVRTHLNHIFQKTGTRRQAELVRLMMRWQEGS